MSNEKPADDPRTEPQTSFGIFYPIGYHVVGFTKLEDAEHVQQALITGGYDQADCLLYTPKKWRAAERNLADNTDFLSRLG
ncbi:MAG TPA: hypothetical protein VKB53_04925, partial [Gammaproteobacteria bacterium]|nr:hypothetical protein [Gammaproteobacteria bacterium]HKH20231.1 hypothetical protein [Gammaproteobacteria bacterium]